MSWIGLLLLASCGARQATKDTKTQKAQSEDSSPAMQCIHEAETVLKAPVDAPERIDMAQIIVRHAGVRDAGDVTRTREEACLRALEARKKLLSGSDWDEVFKQYSDSQGATNGVLFGVTQGELDPKVAGAAFSLDVDELSYVLETKRGYHIIWRKK